MTPVKERITAAQAGETFKLKYPGVPHEVVTVLPPCTGTGHVQEDGTEAKFSGQWWCITHQTGFDNQFAKDTHIDQGTHKLVWHCSGHGFEQP